MKPEISVIVAVHNSERYLRESIQSIINQSFQNWELIIVDDKSTDSSFELIREYQKREPRITIFKNIKNKGPAMSRNLAIKHARGRYLAVLDSDDISLEDRLKTQYIYLETHPDIFLCGSSAIKIDELGDYIGTFEKYHCSPLLHWRLPKSNGIIHSSVMMRNIGQQYSERFKYSHDYEMWLRFLSDGKKLINLSAYLIKFRLHNQSIGATKQKTQRFFRDLAVKDFLDRRKTR